MNLLQYCIVAEVAQMSNRVFPGPGTYKLGAYRLDGGKHDHPIVSCLDNNRQCFTESGNAWPPV
jgi:hypothetical protein